MSRGMTVIPQQRLMCQGDLIKVVVTYQRGARALFAASRRVLSPPGVEGVSLTSSAVRVLSPHGVEGVSPSSSTHAHRVAANPGRPCMARNRPGDMTPVDRETCLTHVNIHLKKLLVKANRDKDML